MCLLENGMKEEHIWCMQILVNMKCFECGDIGHK